MYHLLGTDNDKDIGLFHRQKITDWMYISCLLTVRSQSITY